ncbi:MAG: deoxyhypusine synthase family protein, partial [Myxococcales bacterium]|nr:deoxyhypusine synthase family protein [Myxococcales bacterium]
MTAETAIRQFMAEHYLHFNSREVVSAAKAWEAHLAAGGKMLVTLAGAMSTARIGKLLARLIRAGKVHAISCTGANLEEDVFTLLEADNYEYIPNWRALSAEDEQALLDRGMNRVTDTCIPETVMRHIEARLIEQWQAASAKGQRLSPAEHLWAVLEDPTLAQHYQIPAEESWLLAAKEMGIP